MPVMDRLETFATSRQYEQLFTEDGKLVSADSTVQPYS